MQVNPSIDRQVAFVCLQSSLFSSIYSRKPCCFIIVNLDLCFLRVSTALVFCLNMSAVIYRTCLSTKTKCLQRLSGCFNFQATQITLIFVQDLESGVCVCVCGYKTLQSFTIERKSGISYFTMAVDISPTLLNYCGKLTKTFR